MKVSNQVHTIMGYKLPYGAYSSTTKSIRSVKRRGSAIRRGAKKGKSPVETFQRKLVVFRYVILQSIIGAVLINICLYFRYMGGSIAPKHFTRKDSLIVLRGMTPEIPIDATEEEVRREICEMLQNSHTFSQDCEADDFEFISMYGKHCSVPAVTTGTTFNCRAIKTLAGAGSLYIRLLRDLEADSDCALSDHEVEAGIASASESSLGRSPLPLSESSTFSEEQCMSTPLALQQQQSCKRSHSTPNQSPAGTDQRSAVVTPISSPGLHVSHISGQGQLQSSSQVSPSSVAQHQSNPLAGAQTTPEVLQELVTVSAGRQHRQQSSSSPGQSSVQVSNPSSLTTWLQSLPESFAESRSCSHSALANESTEVLYESLSSSPSDSEFPNVSEALKKRELPLNADITLNRLQEIFPNFKYGQLKYLLGACNDTSLVMEMLVNGLDVESLRQLVKSNCITKDISESPRLRLDADDDESEWVEATLAFYKAKKYESDAEIRVVIRGQPGIDTGGLRRQVFSVVLRALVSSDNLKLFEGNGNCVRPVYRLSNMSSGILKVTGTIIAHSYLLDGQGFPFLSECCYYYLCGCTDKAMTAITEEDLGKDVQLVVREVCTLFKLL